MKDDVKFRFVMHIIIPAACCIIIGYIPFGGMIFKPHMTVFQIIISGILASLFIAVLKFASMKNSLAVIFVLILLEEVFITKPAGIDYIIRDTAYLGALVISVLLFYKLIYKNAAPALYPLFSLIAFAVVFAVCLTIFLLYKSFESGSPLGSDFIYLPFQILIYSIIGLGVGTGTFFADKYFPLEKLNSEGTKVEADEGINADE